MSFVNRFDNEMAVSNSCYLAYRDGRLADALSGVPAPETARFAHDQFRAMVLNEKFPCIGARYVVRSNSYRLGWYHRMATPEATAGLCRDLCTFVLEQMVIGSKFTSFFAMFEAPNPANEKHFERLLWRQLQAVHDMDSQYYDWDPKVSDDPHDPRFAFSVAGRGFFIVGLHAGSSRPDRRFAYPTLIFNAQFMFDRLREDQKFEAFQQMVRTRTDAMGLCLNPNLANFGEESAARQYSGQKADSDWICPLRVRESQSFNRRCEAARIPFDTLDEASAANSTFTELL